MKKKITIPLILLSGLAYSQVGINTESPKTIMDIRAKRNSSGAITDNSQTYGLQAPRLTRAELTDNTAIYGTDQNGAIIYITDISGGNATIGTQREYITSIGYYYFDAITNRWQKFGNATSGNVYTGSNSVILNGNSFERAALTGDVTANQNSNATSVVKIQGTPVSTIAPTSGQVLKYNGTNWTPSTDTNTTYTASNGLTMKSNNTKLGGTLNEATIITTSASNTLSIKGLQNGDVTDDKLIVADNSGVIKTASLSSSFIPYTSLVAFKTTSTSTQAGASSTLVTYNSRPRISGLTYNAAGTFTVNKAGYYQIIVNVSYDVSMNSPTSGSMLTYIQKNNGTIGSSLAYYENGTQIVYQSASTIAYLNVGDVIGVRGSYTRQYRVTSSNLSMVNLGN